MATKIPKPLQPEVKYTITETGLLGTIGAFSTAADVASIAGFWGYLLKKYADYYGYSMDGKSAVKICSSALLGMAGYYNGIKQALKMFHALPVVGSLAAMGVSSYHNVIFTYRFALTLTDIFQSKEIEWSSMANAINRMYANTGKVKDIVTLAEIADLFADGELSKWLAEFKKTMGSGNAQASSVSAGVETSDLYKRNIDGKWYLVTKKKNGQTCFFDSGKVRRLEKGPSNRLIITLDTCTYVVQLGNSAQVDHWIAQIGKPKLKKQGIAAETSAHGKTCEETMDLYQRNVDGKWYLVTQNKYGDECVMDVSKILRVAKNPWNQLVITTDRTVYTVQLENSKQVDHWIAHIDTLKAKNSEGVRIAAGTSAPGKTCVETKDLYKRNVDGKWYLVTRNMYGKERLMEASRIVRVVKNPPNQLVVTTDRAVYTVHLGNSAQVDHWQTEIARLMFDI